MAVDEVFRIVGRHDDVMDACFNGKVNGAELNETKLLLYLEKGGHKCGKRTIKPCIILMDVEKDENGGKRQDIGIKVVENSERMDDRM